VLHAWWGLNDTIRKVCDRLAGEGFVAYAPDLYHGQLASTIETAEALSSQFDAERGKADLAAALDKLCEVAKLTDRGIGVVGFSFGAYFALQLSCTDPERVRAVVLFYGTGPGDFTHSQAAYLGHYAEMDPYEPAEYVDGLDVALKSSGRPVTFYRYPGVGHWFFEPDRPQAYHQAAATLAWERTLAFLMNSL
jgi:carboxymethylenebutenolidase